MGLIETRAFCDATEERASGTLWVPYALTEPGVYAYNIHGKQVRVLKAPEDWHSESFLRSAMNAPITDEHPGGDGLFRPEDTRPVVGMSDSAPATVRDTGLVTHGGALFQRAAIDKVAKRQVSAVSVGFLTRLEHLPGVWADASGVKHEFDAVQRDPKVNHVALTRSPRVQNARILLDSTGRQFFGTGHGNLVMNLTEALAQCDSQIGEVLKATLGARDAELSNLKTQLDSLRGELTAAKMALDSAPRTEQLDAQFRARLELVQRVAKHAPGLALDSIIALTDAKAIYVAALDSLGIKVPQNESEEYLRAVLEFAPKSPGNQNSVRAALMGQDSTNPTDDLEKRRIAAQMKRYGKKV